MLTATIDFGPSSAGSGTLRIGVLPDDATDPPAAFSLKNSVPLTANATDATMHWFGGCGGPDLTYLVGKIVKLEVSLEGDAMLYRRGRLCPASGGGRDSC